MCKYFPPKSIRINKTWTWISTLPVFLFFLLGGFSLITLPLCLHLLSEEEKVPHRLDQSYEQYLNTSCVIAQRPHTRPHPHSSTLPRTPVSPALSALGGICISNRANSHTTVQSASHSHLPLVSERSLLRVHRPSVSSPYFLSKIQLRSKNMTANNLPLYILIYSTREKPALLVWICLISVIWWYTWWNRGHAKIEFGTPSFLVSHSTQEDSQPSQWLLLFLWRILCIFLSGDACHYSIPIVISVVPLTSCKQYKFDCLFPIQPHHHHHLWISPSATAQWHWLHQRRCNGRLSLWLICRGGGDVTQTCSHNHTQKRFGSVTACCWDTVAFKNVTELSLALKMFCPDQQWLVKWSLPICKCCFSNFVLPAEPFSNWK